jgi:DNA-binding NarL/FixJ family response regulator
MQSARRIRVLIVEHQAVVREGLRHFLSSADDIETAGEAEDGDSALALCARLLPDVVLVDLHLPAPGGIETILRLYQCGVQVRVIALANALPVERVRKALQAGAASFLRKDMTADELLEAIRETHAGRRVLPRDVAQQLLEVAARTHPSGESLSRREIDVLTLMAAGLDNAMIADRLAISRNTVRHHVRNILAKLKVANRTAAVGLAMQQGLVDHDPPDALPDR